MLQGLTAAVSTVLLIEADPSLRRLISLGLQHNGMHVIEASSLQTIPALAISLCDLLIVDIDAGVTSSSSLLPTLQANLQLSTMPAVMLSWEQPSAQLLSANSSSTEYICLSKPFDARALYMAATQLLQIGIEQKAAQEAQAEAALLATYSKQMAPSIWPFVTAAGLLLIVVGLLMQFAIAVLGLLIVFSALIIWNFGTRPEAVNTTLRSNDVATSSV